MDVSSSGEYVAIVSADHDKAHVGIWDMETVIRSTSTSVTENRATCSLSRSSPKATTGIPLPKRDSSIMRLVRIAISSDGLRAVLYQQPHNDDLNLHSAHLAQTAQIIEDTSIHLFMSRFVGYGKFMSRDTFGTGSQVSSDDIGGVNGDYFVTCNESRIAVYDVDNGFQPLHGISIGGPYSMKSRAD
ncbi:MAG: hypothetical protein J3Q66DRAFT_433114 [Benniella sp.]|nr:MAG: hypothetical protein J3Q66DRAFT_433114 [Benniella sp.]